MKISFQSLNKVYKVRVAESLVIAPTIMVTDVQCRVQEDLNLEDIEGIVESGGSLEGRYSAGVLQTAVTVKIGLFAIFVFNLSDKPVRIYRCSFVGTLHPLVEHNFKLQRNMGSVCYRVVSPLLNSHKTKEHSQNCAVRTEKSQDTLALMAELFPINNEFIFSEEKRLHHEVIGLSTLVTQKEKWVSGVRPRWWTCSSVAL